MKVVIVGGGETGRLLAEQLLNRGEHEVTIIEADGDKADRLANSLDALVLHGDGTRPEILEKARLYEADALVATTGSDAVNTVIVLLARRYEVGRVAVRLKNEDLRAACHEAGVDYVVTPKVTAVSELIDALCGDAHLDLSVFDQSGVYAVRLPFHRSCPVREVDLPEGAILIGVVRADEDVALPRAAMELDPGDELVLLVDDEKVEAELRKRLGTDERHGGGQGR